MKITFYSNFLNHHQLPFCKAMVELIGERFTFVATEPISAERVAMGYVDMNKAYPFILRTYDSEAEYEKARNLARTSDVIILGSAPNEFVDIRMQNNRLTFRYSERLFKKGTYRRFIPPTRKKINASFTKYRNKNLYTMCASAYTSSDLELCGFNPEKCIEWGYFPELKEYDIEKLIKSKHGECIKVLWVGRFIGLKHPELALLVAQRLDREDINFHLKMIGNGKDFEKSKRMADNMGLKHPVEFLGAMAPSEVRRHMEEANIYLLTSDFNEGWGAVLNESMNSGCAVVASHAIGAVPFLIKHRENGLIYENGNTNDLCDKVMIFARDLSLSEKMGKNAYYTLKNTWNAKVAAERLLKLADGLLSGNQIKFATGPCSRANIIKNNWFCGEEQ